MRNKKQYYIIYSTKHIKRVYLMSEKRAKLIEFDEETIMLVNHYGKTRNINTFSGTIRTMVEKELNRYGLSSNQKIKENPDVVNQLSDVEYKKFQEIKKTIGLYNEIRIAYAKVFDEIKNKEENSGNLKSKTTFERLVRHYANPGAIDYLFEIVRCLFSVKGKQPLEVDKVLKELSLKLKRMELTDVDVFKLESIESTDIHKLKIVIKQYDEVIGLEGIQSNQNYNDLMQQYFEYKEGNISKYSIIRTLSEYIRV